MTGATRFLVAAALVVAATAPAHAADSPLKTWMKGKLQPAKAKGDFDTVSKLLTALAAKNPDAATFPDWRKHCDAGIQAAQKQDKTALNNSCNACHKAYRKLVREKFPTASPP